MVFAALISLIKVEGTYMHLQFIFEVWVNLLCPYQSIYYHRSEQVLILLCVSENGALPS